MANLDYRDWHADGGPYGELYEGGSVPNVALSVPDNDDAETIPSLIFGTSNAHLASMQSQMDRFLGVGVETPLFRDVSGDYVDRSFDTVLTVGSGSSTTTIVIAASQTPSNSGDGVNGLPFAVVYKGGSTDSSSWIFETGILSGMAWSTDHWTLSTSDLSTAPSSGDIIVIGAIVWHYEFWKKFVPGSISADSCRMWIDKGVPNDAERIVQVLEIPSGDDRADGESASNTKSVTAAMHAARSRISLGKVTGTMVRVIIRGITANQRVRFRWVNIEWTTRNER